MPIRSADSSKIFNKEYVFSYPEQREEIGRIFSRLANEEIDPSEVSKITRIGYLKDAKKAFEKEFEDNMPANHHTWIKAWTSKEAAYLASSAEEDEESEHEEFDLSQESLAEKDEKIATLLEEIEQRNTQLERLHDDLKQFQIEVDNDSDSTLAALDETKDTLKSTQQRNHALSTELERQKQTVEHQEQEIETLISKSNDLKQIVSRLRDEIKDLKSENKQDKKIYNESVETLDKEHQAEINVLQGKIRSLDQQIEQLTDEQADELIKQRSELGSEISNLQQQINLLHRHLEETQELLDASEDNLSKAQLLITKLEAQNQQALLEKQSALEATNSVQHELALTTETLQSLQEEHTALQERADKLEENNTGLLAQVNELQTTVRTKDSYLQAAEQAKASLTETLETAESRLTALQSEMAALVRSHETANTALQQQLAQSQLSITQLDEAKQSALDAVDRLQLELSLKAGALEALQGEHTQLQERAGGLEENNAGLLVQVNELQTTVRTKISDLQAAEQAKASLTETLETAETRLTALQSEMAALVESHEIAITALQQQLAQSQLSITKLDAEKQQALLEKQSALETVERLQLELSSKTETMEAFQATYRELQRHAGGIEKDNTALLEQIDTLKEAVRTKVNALQTAEQANETLAEELDSTKLYLFKAENTVSTLKDEMAAQVDAHKQNIQGLNSELTQERALNADLRTQIEEALREKQRSNDQNEAMRLKVESTLGRLELSKTAYEALQLQLEQSLEQNAALLRQLEEGRVSTMPQDAGSDSGFDDSPESLSPTDDRSFDLDEQPRQMGATNTSLEALSENEPETDNIAAPIPIVNAEPAVENEEQPPILTAPPRVEEPRPQARRQQEADSSDKLSAFWSTFLQHGGVMEKYFHDQLVKKGQQPALEHWEEDELSIRAQRETTPLYELVEIQKGDFIHSTAQFDKEGGAPGEKVIGKLVQDHTGRVINKTKDTLSTEQQCILALRQAEMILNNYNPSEKDNQTILIEGNASNALQGKRLIAALLLLKQQPGYHDKLKDIEIVSNVPGCELPKPVNGTFSFIKGKQTQEDANKKFINDFLPVGTLADTTTRAQIQKQVGDFAAVKTISHERVKAMKEVLHHGREIDGDHVELSEEDKATLQQRIVDATFAPGDTIDLEGTKTPGPRRN